MDWSSRLNRSAQKRLGGKWFAGGRQQGRRQLRHHLAGVLQMLRLRPADVLHDCSSIQRHGGRCGGRQHGGRSQRAPLVQRRRCFNGRIHNARRLYRGETPVEIGLQRPDAQRERRVRGEEIEEAAGEGVAEEHVADFMGVAVAHPRAVGQTADLFQRPGDSTGVAGELHRRGIGQELPLAVDGGLDQVAQEHTQIAQHKHRQTDDQHQRGAVVSLRVAR